MCPGGILSREKFTYTLDGDVDFLLIMRFRIGLSAAFGAGIEVLGWTGVGASVGHVAGLARESDCWQDLLSKWVMVRELG